MTFRILCFLSIATTTLPLSSAEPLPPAGFEAIFNGKDLTGWDGGKLPIQTFPGGEWHEYRVRVEGNHHQHWIDGVPTVDVIDLDEKGRALEGVITVQVHVGPAMKIQYRDFFLQHLPADLPLLTPADRPIPADAVKVVPQGGGAGKNKTSDKKPAK